MIGAGLGGGEGGSACFHHYSERRTYSSCVNLLATRRRWTDSCRLGRRNIAPPP